MAIVIGAVIPSYSNTEKYQGLREELEKMWKVKAQVAPVVIGTLGAMTPQTEREALAGT